MADLPPNQLQDMIAKGNAARDAERAREADFKQKRKDARRAGLCVSEVRALPSRSTSQRKTYWRDLENAEAEAQARAAGEEEADLPHDKNLVHQHRHREVDARSSRRFLTLCCKPVHPGKRKCREHYLREVLHVSSLGDARGKRFRPFKAWQVPLGDMSEAQEALLADKERLPLHTPYEACIAAMSAIDPEHPLKPILARPLKAPKRSRNSRKRDAAK